MTLHIISDALQQRVTAHLSQFGTLARSVLWTGRGSIVVHFAEPITTSATDTRFAPLTVNWSATFRSPDGAIYLNVPASWRKADREAGEGEGDIMPMYLSLSEAQQKAIRAIAGGDPFANVPQGTLKALFEDGWIVGLKEGGRILPPLQLTPAAETMLYEYDVMRLHKAQDFKQMVLKPVQYLRWGNDDQNRHVFEWVDATVTNVGKEMLTLKYADGTTGTRRAVSVRVKPADPVIELVHPAVEEAAQQYRWENGLGEYAPDANTSAPEPASVIVDRMEAQFEAQQGFNAFDVPVSVLIEAKAMQPADPYAWATPERHAEISPISEKLLPLVLRPTTEDGVWLIEDAVTERTMRKGLTRQGVTILSIEEGESADEFLGGEPYTIARFTLGRKLDAPYPSKRQTEPVPEPNSLYAQYKTLRAALPPTTWLIIQVNGDTWNAFMMDANLLRRFAPLCKFTAQTVNNSGEQWDKIEIPAGLIDETVTNATEAGITIALASIVRDEPNTLPVREVTEIHRPNEPVQYLGKEEAPTDWETDADEEDATPQPWQPDILKRVRIKSGLHAGVIGQVTDIGANSRGATYKVFNEWYNASDLEDPNTPMVTPTAAPSKLEMTPELMAAKIRLKLHGGLRVGRIEDVRYDGKDEIEGDWWTVWFAHATSAKNPSILKRIAEDFDIRSYDIGLQNKYTLTVRPKQIAPHGTAIEQATAVIDALPELPAAPEPEPATALLSEDDERDLIAALKLEHADIDAATFGITHFLLNVIAKMRAVEAARVY